MSEHSGNIRQSVYHARKCRYCEEKLLASADYIDTLEQQRDFLLTAAKDVLRDIGIDLGNCLVTKHTQHKLTAAVRACEKTN